jgi:hypothetical protein
MRSPIVPGEAQAHRKPHSLLKEPVPNGGVSDRAAASFCQCTPRVDFRAQLAADVNVWGYLAFTRLMAEPAVSARGQVLLGIFHDQLAERADLLRIPMRHNATDRYMADELTQFIKFHGAVLCVQQPVHVGIPNEFE